MLQPSSPLTLEEHQELARELQAARVRLRELSSVVQDVYGTDSRVAFSARRMMEWIDSLRYDMQAQADRDLPGIATRLYF